MINLNAANMYNVAKEAQEKNRAKFDAHLESVIRDYASRGATSVSFDNDDEMWRVLTEQQQASVANELKEAGFSVGTRRYADPLYVSWRGEQQK